MAKVHRYDNDKVSKFNSVRRHATTVSIDKTTTKVAKWLQKCCISLLSESSDDSGVFMLVSMFPLTFHTIRSKGIARSLSRLLAVLSRAPPRRRVLDNFNFISLNIVRNWVCVSALMMLFWHLFLGIAVVFCLFSPIRIVAQLVWLREMIHAYQRYE